MRRNAEEKNSPTAGITQIFVGEASVYVSLRVVRSLLQVKPVDFAGEK